MTLRPSIQPFSGRRSIRDLLLESPASFVDEEVADVSVSGILWVSDLCQRQYFARDLLFRPFYPFCDVLDDVAVVIACAECHRGVVAARILTQKLFRSALRFDEVLPVETRDRAKTRDAVRDRYLRQRHSAIRARRRFFRARPIFRDPLFEPDQRREIRLVRPNLL